MEEIGKQEIWSFFSTQTKCRPVGNSQVRKGVGHEVESYLELATKVAELQFRNRDYVLLFRGQDADYRSTKNNTMLKPTLFRPKVSGNPNRSTLVERFETLRLAERSLISDYETSKFLGIERLKRHRILRWAILQHYEICRTPLLDVTHSLRIAASFASLSKTSKAFLYVLGVPNLSGAITASAEAGLQIVRLSSVCPPSAIRPHVQEGYLLGEYPDLAGYEQKENYFHYEMDFGRRLVGKFCFDPSTFWKSDDFPRVEEAALYPSAERDRLHGLALRIRKRIKAS